MRSLGISLLSLALTTMVVANAYYQKKQFYPSVVYITKSNPSMAVSKTFYITIFKPRFLLFIRFSTVEIEHVYPIYPIVIANI